LIALALVVQAGAQVAALSAPQADAGKWLAATDAKFKASYQRDVAGPFEKAVGELRRQFLTSLAGPLTAATQAGRQDEVAIWTADREAIAAGGNVAATDEPGTPNSLKTLRASYREQFARLDKQRFDRARALFTQCDALLAKNQAALDGRNRPNDSAELQKERDQLHIAWLQPPAAAAAAAAPPETAGTPAKLTPAQILGKLLAMNASVVVKAGKAGNLVDVKSASQLADQKFTFWRVEFPAEKAEQTPLEPADYAILDSLSDIGELAMRGPSVTDAVIEKLRPFHVLQSLSLVEAKITPASYHVFPTLPELHELYLGNIAVNDEALAAVAQCHKLKNLHLVTLPITDEGMANLGKMPALEQLELNELDKLGSAGFAHLGDCHSLKQIYAGGFTILSGMVEGMGRCKSLEVVALPNSNLRDAEVAPLSALPKLRSLDLSASRVTGSVFAAWPARPLMIALNLGEAPGVDDAALKNIEHAFPKLEELDVKLAASGISTAGGAALAHLHNLRTLHINGEGLNDEMTAQIAHCDALTFLSIPSAKLTETGVAALAKLPHLADLSIDEPPLTEAALKSFGRCKELKTVNIGKDSVAEAGGKLIKAIPGVVVHRPED
jgi:hypothetical protein